MRYLKNISFALASGLTLFMEGTAVMAGSSVQATLLEQELLTKVPPNWQVHVSDRGDMLIAFLTPPYQDAFDLLYAPEELANKMLGFCPATDDVIWGKLRPGQRIMVEPTVGGKSGDALDITCPRDAATASALRILAH